MDVHHAPLKKGAQEMMSNIGEGVLAQASKGCSIVLGMVAAVMGLLSGPRWSGASRAIRHGNLPAGAV
jgi:hypothetical protein